MKLYHTPGACSLSPHIVLRECGADFSLVKVNLRSHQTEDGRPFTTINPKGYVPALELDDGQVLTEGPAIIQYLADRHPQAALAPPAGTLERARLQEWLTFIGTELHKSFSPLFNPAASADWKEAARQGLLRRFAYVAECLSARPFLLGATFTCADAYLYTVLRWAATVKLDLGPWPVLADYRARVEARPAVQAALRAEGLPG
ncbi:MAG: glutathione transferase GstA [Rhodocyclaceae bacterium]|jgi:glutathione S-transferase|nr:glutathione transferase GstA [Rhodocyclaceae bacterium]